MKVTLDDGWPETGEVIFKKKRISKMKKERERERRDEDDEDNDDDEDDVGDENDI